MSVKKLKEKEKIIKDLILFNSVWNKRNKIRAAKELPKEAIKRISVYRGLVKTSFTDVISRIYPLTKKLIGNKWKSLLSEYVQAHPPDSPLLHMVGEKLPEYLQKQKPIIKKYPFISELTRYEWVELEVSEMETNLNGKREKGVLHLNPASKICSFNYPIPLITEMLENNQSLKKIQKSSTNVILYRDTKDLTVRVFELSQSTLDFLDLCKEGYSYELSLFSLTFLYQIPEENQKEFKYQLDELIKNLKKNRILI